MLYLCEKYAPMDTLEKYKPELDPGVTGIRGYDNLATARSKKPGNKIEKRSEVGLETQVGSAMQVS